MFAPGLSMLCCPVYVQALRQADHSSNGSCRMSKIYKETKIMETTGPWSQW
jgi:hypothetical protein